ncbi:MAG TPA: PHP domain-containing protein [Gemmataceae bacterium]|jgi:predicted metal-dependent phosphoesterase TrpH|nr:PHP domain-containing protein [Gemmataceae bacterium]
MKFDSHIHTSRYSPDSVIDPFDLVRRARAVGLDGIVITEHDRLWPEDELDELRRAAPGLVVLGGVEVSGKGGDVLCYGVTDLTNLRRGTPWRELTREVRRQGGVAVAAHPYRWGQEFDELLAEQEPDLGGLEMMSNNMTPDLRAQAAAFLARRQGFATLGNSDAHELHVVGCCYTRFDANIRGMADFVAAVLARKGTATVNPDW